MTPGTWFSVGILGLVVLAFFLLWIWNSRLGSATLLVDGKTTLKVLVAKTPDQIFKGLGGRTTLLPYDGMILVYQEKSQHGIVMRDMEFPIDIVWIDHGVVVDIAPNVPLDNAPEETLKRYYPRLPDNIVLELPAGSAKRHRITIGTKIQVINP